MSEGKKAETTPVRSVRDQIIHLHIIKCRHFTGMINERCKANIPYAAVKRPPEEGERGYQIPCLSDPNTKCDFCSYYSLDEAEAAAEKWTKRVDGTILVVEVIRQTVGEKRGVSGTMNCPVCDKPNMRYSVATNGHIRAVCSQESCVSFMQ